MMETLEIPLKRLEGSPLFAISLTAKELFHSNFWAWMINKDTTNQMAGILFGELSACGDALRAEREEENLDLLIVNSNRPCCYVVENKVKAIPSLSQLERYDKKNIKEAEKTYKKCEGRALLCMLDSPFDSNSWKVLKYGDVAEKLRAMITESFPGFDQYERETIRRYCDLAEDMSTVFSEYVSLSDGRCSFPLIPKELSNKLAEMRLLDTCQKLKVSDFVIKKGNGILSQLRPLVPEKWSLELNQGFGMSGPLFTFDLHTESGESDAKTYFSLGIQVQNFDQYRFFCYQKRDGQTIDPDSTFKLFKELGWFCDPAEKQILGKQTKMNEKRGFCAYGGSWVYQYYQISEKNGNLSYEGLSKNIADDMRRAIGLIPEIEGEHPLVGTKPQPSNGN